MNGLDFDDVAPTRPGKNRNVGFMNFMDLTSKCTVVGYVTSVITPLTTSAATHTRLRFSHALRSTARPILS